MSAVAQRECSAVSLAVSVLYMAIELSASKWCLAMTVGRGQKPRLMTLPAGDLVRLMEEVGKAKTRFGLAASARVVSCYESGRDGFWLHRYLWSQGIENLVIDAASTQVDRRCRRAKTDQIDLDMLLSHLLRHESGERKVFRIVQVLRVEDEDGRHLGRQLEVLKRDRSRISARIQSLLVTQGVRRKATAKLSNELAQVRLWDGSGLPPGLLQRLTAEHARWMTLSDQIRGLEAQRRQLLKQAGTASAEKAQRLQKLRSLGPDIAWSFSHEGFGYRQFRNGRQVGSFAGLTPTPYSSGQDAREQGISKAGNVRMRWRAIELGWLWLHHQPNSKLSLWFHQRFGGGGKRHRRVGIVALARKLLVALWRYLEYGVVPEGATLKP